MNERSRNCSRKTTGCSPPVSLIADIEKVAEAAFGDVDVSDKAVNTSDQTHTTRAAKSGAAGSEAMKVPVELQELVAVWSALSSFERRVLLLQTNGTLREMGHVLE